MATDWVTTVFEGSAGGVVAAAAAFIAAVSIGRRQSKLDRELAQEQRAVDRRVAREQHKVDQALAEEQRASDRELARDAARRQAASCVLGMLAAMQRSLLSPSPNGEVQMLLDGIVQSNQEWSLAWSLCGSISGELVEVVEALNGALDLGIMRGEDEDSQRARINAYIWEQTSRLQQAMTVVAKLLAEF